MGYKNDPRRNASGYMDMTAYKAIKNADKDAAEARYKKLIKIINYLCDISGYQLVNIQIKDKRTGEKRGKK